MTVIRHPDGGWETLGLSYSTAWLIFLYKFHYRFRTVPTKNPWVTQKEFCCIHRNRSCRKKQASRISTPVLINENSQARHVLIGKSLTTTPSPGPSPFIHNSKTWPMNVVIYNRWQAAQRCSHGCNAAPLRRLMRYLPRFCIKLNRSSRNSFRFGSSLISYNCNTKTKTN